MNEPLVTLTGWLGADVRLRQAGGAPVADFRLGVTPRRFDRKTETWADDPTQWYTVNLWRDLAEHCERSLRRGDPVVVHGRLAQHTFVNKAGVEVTVMEVTATSVGHDLALGTSQFARRPSTRSAPAGAPAEEVARTRAA